FDISTVRGFTRPYTWSLDGITFNIAEIFLDATAMNARGELCLAADSGLVDVGATSAVLTVPATCIGRPTTVAVVCVGAFGMNGESTTHCRVYDMPPSPAMSVASDVDDEAVLDVDAQRAMARMLRDRQLKRQAR